jgi:hypothetical protein
VKVVDVGGLGFLHKDFNIVFTSAGALQAWATKFSN